MEKNETCKGKCSKKKLKKKKSLNVHTFNQRSKHQFNLLSPLYFETKLFC